MRIVLVGLLLAVVAGCSSAPEPLTQSSFEPILNDPPLLVVSNQTFTVDLLVSSFTNLESTSHAGAHIWKGAVAEPNAELGRATACTHVGADAAVTVPGGPWTLTCKITTGPGDYTIIGHVRITKDGIQHDWWGNPQPLSVS